MIEVIMRFYFVVCGVYQLPVDALGGACNNARFFYVVEL